MEAWVKILGIVAAGVETLYSWWKEWRRKREVNSIDKAIESDDDSALASKLRAIAKKSKNAISYVESYNPGDTATFNMEMKCVDSASFSMLLKEATRCP